MAIQRWDPQTDLLKLQQNVNRMFEDTLARSSSHAGAETVGGGGWKPPIDLLEETGRFLVRADLPGVASSEVEVRIERDRLVVRGERKAHGATDGATYLRVERPTGRFAVQLGLPPAVDRQRVQASHRNGVLEVILPKKGEDTTSRIDVDDR